MTATKKPPEQKRKETKKSLVKKEEKPEPLGETVPPRTVDCKLTKTENVPPVLTELHVEEMQQRLLCITLLNTLLVTAYHKILAFAHNHVINLREVT